MALLPLLIGQLLLVIPFWRILKRMGLPPALSLLAFLPGLGFLILLYVVAIAKWPALPEA